MLTCGFAGAAFSFNPRYGDYTLMRIASGLPTIQALPGQQLDSRAQPRFLQWFLRL